jgi:hypothetical protein
MGTDEPGGRSQGYATPPDQGAEPTETRASAARLPVLWVAVPLGIVLAVAIAFTLRAVL